MKIINIFLLVIVSTFVLVGCAQTPSVAKKETYSHSSSLTKTTMTEEEINSLRMQLARCWSGIPVNKVYMGVPVELRLILLPDGKVSKVYVVDKNQYKTSKAYKQNANLALQALNKPDCKFLNLPIDKYDLWKDMVVTFDPTEML